MTEDVEISFHLPGDTKRHDTLIVSSQMLQPARQETVTLAEMVQAGQCCKIHNAVKFHFLW
jgi:hypothetical protein